jgi:hypothetical protein
MRPSATRRGYGFIHWGAVALRRIKERHLKHRGTYNAAVHLRRTERPQGAKPGVRCNSLLAIELFEEGVIDLVRLDGPEAELELFKHVDEFLAVYQLDRRYPIT